MSQLSGDFTIELAKACIVDKNILEVVRPHLNYSFLSNQEEKQIFKYIFDYHAANKQSPTIGLIGQNVNSRDALGIIGKIREVNVHDNKGQILKSFEEYIRKARFVDLHLRTEELYNKGEVDKAISLLTEESKSINEFSLVQNLPSRVYEDFEKRQHERENRDYSTRKVPTGIPQHDYISHGGTDLGTGLLFIARSGVGKTTALRSCGHHASFRGFNVVHFASGDSTEEEIMDGYDAQWTNVLVHDIRKGDLSSADSVKLEKARQAYIGQAGEIYVHVFKQFHNASIADCRNIIIELNKIKKIHVALFDLLEGFDPGDGKKYSTSQDGVSARKKATSEKIINIATEFDMAAIAVTQASDIPKELWDNPNFEITRSDISNLKATVDPFAYCITMNQTEDESDNDIMRLREEKTRHYQVHSWQKVYSIVQDRARGKFINVSETLRRFWDDAKKQMKSIYRSPSKPNKKEVTKN